MERQLSPSLTTKTIILFQQDRNSNKPKSREEGSFKNIMGNNGKKYKPKNSNSIYSTSTHSISPIS